MRAYLAGGPQAFYCYDIKRTPDMELTNVISNSYPENRFWMGKAMLHGMDSGARLVIFEKSMEVKVFKATYDHYEMKFEAIKRGPVPCTNCTEMHRIDKCPYWVNCPSNFSTARLAQRPELLDG
jgi:hypothetical protein